MSGRDSIAHDPLVAAKPTGVVTDPPPIAPVLPDPTPVGTQGVTVGELVGLTGPQVETNALNTEDASVSDQEVNGTDAAPAAPHETSSGPPRS